MIVIRSGFAPPGTFSLSPLGLGTTSVEQVEVRVSSKHSTMHRASPSKTKTPNLNSTKVRKYCSKDVYGYIYTVHQRFQSADTMLLNDR